MDIWALGVILYFLLVGKIPFHSFSEGRLFKMIERGIYHLPAGISDGAEYLLSKILKMDPRARISVESILSDTWLQPLDITQRIKMIREEMARK